MKIKREFPYFLSAAMIVVFLASYAIPSRYTSDQLLFKTKYNISAHQETEYDLQKQEIEGKVEQLITTYIDNAINGVQRIIDNKKKVGYVSAVRKELPGAPAKLHCLYGQYTQLNRALEQMGDTIQIIPKTSNAHMATNSFKHYMSKLYNNQEYPNSIHQGHLYATDAEYNRALEKYISSKICKQKSEAQNDLHDKYVQEFKKNNYCATELNPGTIIIVSSGHAVMYLGQGTIKNNKFVSDPNGRAICCAYNAEHTAIYLSEWDVTKSFAADIQNIATQKYYAQLTKSR